MATNRYFINGQTTSANEQKLLNDTIVELIQIHGNDVLYLPRKLVAPDKLFGEDSLSEFKKGYEIEMYVDNPIDYGGEGEIMSKFGLEIRKELTFIVSMTRFAEVTGKDRPVEGDLIWHPIMNNLMEISFVEDEAQLWQLGGQYIYRLSCRHFEYSHEKIDTGFSDVDQVMTEFFNNGTDSNGLKNDRGADNQAIKELGEEVTNFDENSPFGAN